MEQCSETSAYKIQTRGIHLIFSLFLSTRILKSMDTGGSFSRRKAAGTFSYPLISAQVRNACRYTRTSTPTTGLNDMHGKNLTFTTLQKTHVALGIRRRFYEYPLKTTFHALHKWNHLWRNFCLAAWRVPRREYNKQSCEKQLITLSTASTAPWRCCCMTMRNAIVHCKLTNSAGCPTKWTASDCSDCCVAKLLCCSMYCLFRIVLLIVCM